MKKQIFCTTAGMSCPFLSSSRLKTTNAALVTRLARNLKAEFNIPDGDEYVFRFGHGSERSNLAAMTAWIRRDFDEVAHRSPQEIATHFRSRLFSLLKDEK